MIAIDLFAGCGGMSLGFQNAGFEIKAAFDNWKAAIEVYADNFKHPIYNLDLSSSEAREEIKKYSPEIIIGGPPCQDFSIAGHNNQSSKRANLTIDFANIVSYSRPKWFVMENVYNIEKKPVLAKAKDIFLQNGYQLTSRVIDASYVGVPQARKRFFLIGSLTKNLSGFDELLDNSMHKEQMTVFDFMGDELDIEYYYMHPRSYARRAVFSIHEPSSTIRGTNRPIPPNYQQHPADKAHISNNVRPLTTRERSRLQTFPRDFVLNGSKAKLEQVIGNAVPVKMAEFLAKAILQLDREN